MAYKNYNSGGVGGRGWGHLFFFFLKKPFIILVVVVTEM